MTAVQPALDEVESDLSGESPQGGPRQGAQAIR